MDFRFCRSTPRLTALARCAATVPAWRWGPAGYGRSSGADYLYNTYLIGQEKAGVAFEGSSMRKNSFNEVPPRADGAM